MTFRSVEEDLFYYKLVIKTNRDGKEEREQKKGGRKEKILDERDSTFFVNPIRLAKS